MKTIHKFPINGSGIVMMPIKAKILSVQLQGGVICLWAEVDTNFDKEARHILISGTGHRLDDFEEKTFIGTVQENGLVWHIFETL